MLNPSWLFLSLYYNAVFCFYMLNPACIDSIWHITHGYPPQSYIRGVKSFSSCDWEVHPSQLPRVHENAVYSRAEYLEAWLVQQWLTLPGECRHGAGEGYTKGSITQPEWAKRKKSKEEMRNSAGGFPKNGAHGNIPIKSLVQKSKKGCSKSFNFRS